VVRARLGVVLPLPAPTAAEVDGVRRALGDDRVGAVPPHVTLVPPVNVAPRAENDALAAVRDAAARTLPLSVVLGPAATFWPVTPVVYLSVQGDVAGIERLHDAFDHGPWARPTTWPFVPHVTLMNGMEPARIPAAVHLLAAYRNEVTLTAVRVMREEVDGAWTLLEDTALSGRHVVGRGGLEVVIDAGSTPDREAVRRLAGAWGRDASPFALTARREGAVVGAATGTTDDVLWLDRLVVDPAARDQGVGSHLLRAVEALGAARGCALAVAVCRAGSPAAAWLSSRGWREDLSLPGWYPEQDHVRVARHL
jgi:2'-5' RNA ligase/ribosomal protein S18 acetylase RimI-like enzyme